MPKSGFSVARVTWTPQAIDDIEKIRDFISRDSPTYGSLVAQRLVETVGRLEQFPASGRIVPEFRDETIREVLWGSFRVVYRYADGRVDVLTVYHGARILHDPRGGK
ncbi:type II toxin-antitoxin system RelE/ParE family toxin [bacterium]|nr:type II toxin-antitoxin system RelE/ParE family toxin [bacterium]